MPALGPKSGKIFGDNHHISLGSTTSLMGSRALWLAIVLAFLGAGAVLGMPRPAEASVTAFDITGYDFYTGRLSYTYSTSWDNCPIGTYRRYLYIQNEAQVGSFVDGNEYRRTGAYLYAGSGNGCPARDGATATTHYYNGSGSRTVWAHQGRTGTSNYSDTYSFPTRVSIDASTSVSGDTLTVNWSSISVSSNADWHYLITSERDGTVLQSGMLAENSPATRSASILLNLPEPGDDETATGVYRVLVFVSISDPSSVSYPGGGFLAPSYSNFFTFSYNQLAACGDGDISDWGYVDGYSHDVSGNLRDATCSVHASVWGHGDVSATPANIYSFRLISQRDVSLTLTPVTEFAGSTGGYKIRVRNSTPDGTIIGEGTGTDSIELTDLSIGAGIRYVVEVMRYGTGGGQEWTLTLFYGYITPPTATPAPTPTPRIQPNLDFRLYPNPAGIGYTADETYSFESEGPPNVYPLTVRSANPAALELSVSSSIVCNITAPDSVRVDDSDTLHVRACTAGRNTTLQVISDGGDLVGEYPVYVRGGPVPTPAAAVIGQGIGQDVSKRDLIGITIVVGVVCGGFGVGCDVDLVTNLIVTAVAVGVMAFLLRKSRGAATSMGIGVAATFAVVVLMLGHLWVGFPLWVVGIVLTTILAVGGTAFVVKGRQVA